MTRPPGRARVARWVVFGAAAAIAVAWAAFVDLVAASAAVHPIACALALSPVAMLALVAWLSLHRTEPNAKWLFGSALALSVLVVLAPWNERKRFVHDVFSVDTGMSVDDVEAVMHGYLEGPGEKWHVPQEAADQDRAALDALSDPSRASAAARAHFTGTMTFRWSTSGAFDSDWGQVRFVNGKVVDVAFVPD